MTTLNKAVFGLVSILACTAQAGGTRAEWITRAQWGARAPKANVTLPDKISDFSLGKVQGIVIHQTESPTTWSLKRLETYFRDDSSGPRFRDIAYHFVIRQEGPKGPWKVYEGRDGSAQAQKKLGMHALDNNPGNIGIAVMGNFPSGSSSVLADDLRKTLHDLVEELIAENPSVKFLWGHGELRTLSRGSDHIPKDQWSAGHTNCPGPPLLQVVRDFRKEFNLFGQDPRAMGVAQVRDAQINVQMLGSSLSLALRFKQYDQGAALSFASAVVDRASSAQLPMRREEYKGVAAGRFGTDFQALLWRYPGKKKTIPTTPEVFLVSAMNFGSFSPYFHAAEPVQENAVQAWGEFERGNPGEWIRARVEHLAVTVSAKQLAELANYPFAQSTQISNGAEVDCAIGSGKGAYVSLLQLTGLWPGEVARVVANCGSATSFTPQQFVSNP